MWSDRVVLDDTHPDFPEPEDRYETQIRLDVWNLRDAQIHAEISKRIAAIKQLYQEIDVLAEEARVEVEFSLKSERTPTGCDDVSLKWQSSAGLCGYL